MTTFEMLGIELTHNVNTKDYYQAKGMCSPLPGQMMLTILHTHEFSFSSTLMGHEQAINTTLAYDQSIDIMHVLDLKASHMYCHNIAHL